MLPLWPIIRWINLWWPANFAEDVTSASCTVGSAADLGAVVFVGSLVLDVGILLGILFLHILLVSLVEAYWMSEVSV